MKTTILEMRQFLKGRDISQSIMEVNVFHPKMCAEMWAPKIWELVPDSITQVKIYIFKNKAKVWTTDKCPCRLLKNHIGKLGLFKAVPITFIAVISFFSILGHKKFIKVICLVCFFHLVKFAQSNCVLLLFRSIGLFYLATISHVSLYKHELGFTWN